MGSSAATTQARGTARGAYLWDRSAEGSRFGSGYRAGGGGEAAVRTLVLLASFDERKSRIVELRFFGGMTEEETAEAMNISLRTLQREWSLARAWLYNELKK